MKSTRCVHDVISKEGTTGSQGHTSGDIHEKTEVLIMSQQVNVTALPRNLSSGSKQRYYVTNPNRPSTHNLLKMFQFKTITYLNTNFKGRRLYLQIFLALLGSTMKQSNGEVNRDSEAI